MTDDTDDKKPGEVVELFAHRPRQTIPAPPSINSDDDDEDTSFSIPKPSEDDYLGFVHVLRYMRRLSISRTVTVSLEDDNVHFTIEQRLPGTIEDDDYTERRETFAVTASTLIDFEGIDIPESEEDYTLSVDLAVETVDTTLDLLLTPVEHDYDKG